MDVRGPEATTLCCVEDIVVTLPSCNMLVSVAVNNSVKVVDVQTGRLLSHLHLPGRPASLCLLPGDRAAVLLPDERAIQIIDISSDQLRLLDNVKVAEKYVSLAYMNNKFMVGSSDLRCVASLNIEGKLLKSVSKDNTGNQLFENPLHICVTTDIDGPSVYVSDWGNHTITRLSEELEVMQTFGVPIEYELYDLAAAGGGQLILIVDSGNTKLLVLDTGTGEFTELLEDVGDWGIYEASRVTFCPRLGRVYTNTGSLVGVEYIRVFEIS